MTNNNMTLFYRRVGPWPAFTPDAFEVTADHPNQNLRIQIHGDMDQLPGPRLVWMLLSLPNDPMAGPVALTKILQLSTAQYDAARTGVLVADAIALYRAICRFANWQATYDASHWLAELPENAVIQRRALERVCSA